MLEGNGEGEDPDYINFLLDSIHNHDCYFLVGNPLKETPERIGVVPGMLMAHSVLLNRVLNSRNTELSERWDITTPNISPRTFKNFLRFSYGYTNIKSYNIRDTLDLLRVGDILLMQLMVDEVSKHIDNIMSAASICEILQEQVCLDIASLESKVSRLIKGNSKEVFAADNLHLICPSAMRYILGLNDLEVSPIAVWRAVIKWARRKVLPDSSPRNELDALTEPDLIVPCLKHTRLCMLNLIAIVEEVIYRREPDREYLAQVSSYHFVANNPEGNSVSICDVNGGGKKIVHNSYRVKVIYNSSFLTDPEEKTKTELVITTPDCHITLHALVCTGISKTANGIEDIFRTLGISVGELGPAYECRCTVRVTLVTDTEKTDVAEVQFVEEALFDEEFKIPLDPDGKKLRLEPNSKYVLETTFAMAHPFRYTHDIDYHRPGEDKDLLVGCGIVDESKMRYGSHVKFLLYNRNTPST